jgi:hypothetical protein
MSNTRYIEINSAYRDRNLWPDPAEFEVQISESGTKQKDNAVDPVCNSMVVTSWVSNAFVATSGVMITCASNGTASLQANGNQILLIQSADQLQPTEDYYVGAVGRDNNGIRRRVIGYKYLGYTGVVYKGQFTFETAFPEPTAYDIQISDPTDLTITSHTLIFVPNGRESNNAYPNMIMYNETKETSGTIIDYSADTHLATVEAPSGWAVTDAYSIRTNLPAFTFDAVFGSTPSVITLPTTYTGNYKGDYLRCIDNEVTPITPVVAPVWETALITKYLYLSTTFTSSDPASTSAFTLTSGSSVDSYYVGGYLIDLLGNLYLVLTYNGTTKSGTVSGSFDPAVLVGTSANMRSAFVSPAFASISSIRLELLSFTRDNYVPISYSGSMDSQQNNVCYEIELINLTLPNRILATGYGSRVSFYPYMYVEFYNLSSRDRNIIYSNNPNSTKMLFRVPIDDIPNLIASSFIKLDSDCCVQTVKFKPNDTMHFSVRLGNGELFKTVLEEDFSPSEPNPLIQVSAIFSIKRL